MRGPPGAGRRRGAVAVVAGLLVALLAPTGAAAAGDGLAAAGDGLLAEFSGSIDAAGASWRTHALVSDGDATVTATLDWDDAAADLNLGLRDPAGTWVAWASSATAKPEVLDWVLDQPGTWTFGVSARTGRADYTLVVAVAEPPPDPVPGQDHFTGTIDADGASWRTHRIDVTAAGPLHAVLDWDDAVTDLNLGVQDPSGAWVQWASSRVAKPEEIWLDATVTGTWTVAVKARTGAAAYTLAVGHSGSVVPPDPEPPPPTTTVPPPDDTTPAPGGEVFTWHGQAAASGTAWRDHDHEVTGPSRLTATLDWDDPAANLDLFLRDPAGAWVASATSLTARPETVTVVASTAGTWRLGVRATSGGAGYTLTLRVEETTAPTAPVHVRQIGGPARAEVYPSGIDVDGHGSAYLADTGNDRVAAYAPDGSRRWAVGGRGHAAGRFTEPRDVAYSAGRVYVADTGSNRVQVLDAADGALVDVWSHWFRALMGVSAGHDGQGDPVILATDGVTAQVSVHTLSGARVRTLGTGPGAGPGQLDEPRDAATDAAGTVFVADFRNHRVARFAADGTWLGSFGELGSAPGQFSGPYGVEVDDVGRVYVADSNNGRVQMFTPEGAHLASWGTRGTAPHELRQLRNVAVGTGPAPDVYAVDLWGNKALRWSHDGTLAQVYGGGEAALGGFNKPYGLAVSPGRVLVSDTTNQRIQRFTGEGVFELAWGDRGFAESADGMNWPRDVTDHPQRGTVWVADTKNDRIVEYTPEGVPTGVQMGRRGSGIGQLHWPHAVAAVDGDVIVVDTANNRVQRWRPPNVVLWTTTGFSFPKDVTAHDGVLYVADSLHRRIVRLDAADGTFVDQFGYTDLHRPEGVAVTPDGAVWVSDTSWNRLVQFSAAGRFVQRFGQQGVTPGRFDEPTKLAIVDDSGGTALLHVADTGNDRIEVFRIDR